MQKVTIAGASGHIGTHLLKEIQDHYLIKALSRSKRKSHHSHIEWKSADLFSLSSTDEAFKDCDIAFYLVHSMMPSSRLFQGSFYDTDLMLADNFIRACKKHHIKQIIYLGGPVLEGHMSPHLKSRREVEEILFSSGIPCTIFRAGLVVGDGGSSYEILKNLVHNLPLMILPKWTNNFTPIIFLDDLIKMLAHAINNQDFFNTTINAVCGEYLTYKDLIQQTMIHLKKRTPLIPVPINYASFSKLWVSFFGQSSYELTAPLIDSLLCDFSEITPSKIIQKMIDFPTYQTMLSKVSKNKKKKISPKKVKKTINNVRSIQRSMEYGPENANLIAEKYLNWIPTYMNSLIQVQFLDSHHLCFRVLSFGPILLKLQYIPSKEQQSRVKFHVVGGLLTKTKNTGWLEFRCVCQGRFILCSINEFVPALPWFIYRFTQAPIHKRTMDKFGVFLQESEKIKLPPN